MKKKFLIQKLLGLLLIVLSIIGMVTFEEDGSGLILTLLMGLYFTFCKDVYLD